MTPVPSHPLQAAVVGGGIVGLAVAWTLLRRHPDLHVTLFEKEPGPARHQTGRNSGVLHSGLYYAPGSAKARHCRSGKAHLEAFCGEHGIPFERCGKVVVATRSDELPRLAALAERAAANGVDVSQIDSDALHAIEPHASGIAALHVPESGIVDYKAVCTTLARLIEATGRGTLRFGVRVERIEHASPDNAVVHLHDDERHTVRAAVSCAGLHSDRVARASGARTTARVVPFRGEYYKLTHEAQHLVRHLIYPVPDPRFPFLGVHFTRMVDGSIECGPNAVFALAREGYRWRDVSPRDIADALLWPGTLRLFARHWRTGLGETWRSVSKRAFVHALQRLVPAIRAKHLQRVPAGVRAQALRADGMLVDDFLIERHGRTLHVLNAPSPAATASLAIAESIADDARALLTRP